MSRTGTQGNCFVHQLIGKGGNRGRIAAPLIWNAHIVYSIDIAVTGQLSTACWQSHVSQAFWFTTHALSSRSSNTLGQSSVQSPHPIHRSISTFGVAIIHTVLSSDNRNEFSCFNTTLIFISFQDMLYIAGAQLCMICLIIWAVTPPYQWLPSRKLSLQIKHLGI